MADITFHRVNSQPAVLQVGAVYFQTKTANTADLYFANNAGQRVDILTNTIITSLIASEIAALEASKVVADIAARNALTVGEGTKAYVIDASADSTVDSGAAGYIYTGSSWIKSYEVESMDIDLSSLNVAWSQITGGPSSTPTQIDAAVTASHGHSNKTVLDDLTDVGGKLNYNGTPIAGTLSWTTEAF